MNSNDTVLVQPYIALIIPFCTVFTDCCYEKYNFQKTLFVNETIDDGECVLDCMWTVGLPADWNQRGVLDHMAHLIYCTVECLTNKFKLVDEKGDIITHEILKNIDGALILSEANKTSCFDGSYEVTRHGNITYNDKAMQAMFCLWKEAQMGCTAADPLYQEECNSLKSLLASGQDIAMEDVFSCAIEESASMLDALSDVREKLTNLLQ